MKHFLNPQDHNGKTVVPGALSPIKTELSNIKVNASGKLTRRVRPQYLLGKANSSRSAVECFREIWDKDLLTEQEQVYVIYVDSQLNILEWRCHFTGGLDASTVDLKIIFKHALNLKARGFFIAHNHPQGGLEPSNPDKEVTYAIYRACCAIGLDLLDHVIITKDGYYSFHEGGLL